MYPYAIFSLVYLLLTNFTNEQEHCVPMMVLQGHKLVVLNNAIVPSEPQSDVDCYYDEVCKP